jgi:hypothetical protein
LSQAFTFAILRLGAASFLKYRDSPSARTFLLALPGHPSTFVNIEFHQTFISHFHKERLASFLIRNIGAFHDLIDFKRLLA